MRKKKTKIAVYIAVITFFSIILTSCLMEEPLKIPFESFTPVYLGDGWEIAEPSEAGMDCKVLEDVYRYVHKDANLWQIRSLLVFRNNKLVAESYMKNRNDRNNLHAIWSCTKQVIGILTGMAIERNLISLEDKISDFFPNAPSNKKEITIENLLMMTSGIDYENSGARGGDALLSQEVPSSIVDFILDMGMHASVGTTYRYKNSDPHLLSAIIQQRVGKTTRDWAKEVLFDKIGITRLEWRNYKDGITFGGYGISTTPREMGKFGQLIANNGIWNGEQIISKNWIDEMTSSKVSADEVKYFDLTWGYQWWKEPKRNVFIMMGHGGQLVFINRDKNLVVVMTSEKPDGKHSLPVNSALSIVDRITGSITD